MLKPNPCVQTSFITHIGFELHFRFFLPAINYLWAHSDMRFEFYWLFNAHLKIIVHDYVISNTHFLKCNCIHNYICLVISFPCVHWKGMHAETCHTIALLKKPMKFVLNFGIQISETKTYFQPSEVQKIHPDLFDIFSQMDFLSCSAVIKKATAN